MNLATFRSRVSGAIGLSNTDGSLEQSLIDGWVNEAVEQFLVLTKMHQRTAALAVTADQGDYELDTHILSFKNAWIEPADGSTDIVLEQVDASTIHEARRYQAAAPTNARWFALEGANQLLLYPSPGSSSDLLHITYVPRPTALSATADAPSATANGGIPSEYHPTLELYVKWKAAEYADDRSSQAGMTYRQQWLEGVAFAKGQMLRKGGVRIGRARFGRAGRRRWPVTPGTDTGA